MVRVGARRDHRQRYAVSVHHGGAFDASLPPVHRAFARLLAPARSLRDTAIDAKIGHLQADDPIALEAKAMRSRASITPASIPSWRLRGSVVAEEGCSAILQSRRNRRGEPR